MAQHTDCFSKQHSTGASILLILAETAAASSNFPPLPCGAFFFSVFQLDTADMSSSLWYLPALTDPFCSMGFLKTFGVCSCFSDWNVLASFYRCMASLGLKSRALLNLWCRVWCLLRLFSPTLQHQLGPKSSVKQKQGENVYDSSDYAYS